LTHSFALDDDDYPLFFFNLSCKSLASFSLAERESESMVTIKSRTSPSRASLGSSFPVAFHKPRSRNLEDGFRVFKSVYNDFHGWGNNNGYHGFVKFVLLKNLVILLNMKNKVSDINDLLEIIRKLRAPGGCPWDRKQTHKSIRSHLVEETYEFIDAVNSGDPEHMKEELGDILLHVVFHADIEREKGRFNFKDVTDSISRKLIRRHPHVFKDVHVNGVNDIIKNWEEIKAGESTKKDRKFAMDSVPSSLPAMAKARKTLHIAGKARLIDPENDQKNSVGN